MAQSTLPTEKIVIFTDTREMKSGVVVELMEYDCLVKPKMLKLGDYILSDRVCIERKTYDDFISSIMDRRLFSQVQDMSQSYEKSILIIEGQRQREVGINENAIKGALASIITDYNVSIIFSENHYDTASILYWIAKREQKEKKRSVVIRGKRSKMDLHDYQEFIVSGLPKIDRKTSRKLLTHFGSVERVFSATEEDLKSVKGIGNKLAKIMRNIITANYEQSK